MNEIRRDSNQPSERVMLGIDLLVAALLAPDESAIDQLIQSAEKGEIELLVSEFSLHQALCAVREDEEFDRLRWARLKDVASLVSTSASPEPPYPPPTEEEVRHWRALALRDEAG